MIYTARQVKKKLYLVLLLGILLGWCAHILTVQAVIHYHQSKPIILGSVAYAQEKSQSYCLEVWAWTEGEPFRYASDYWIVLTQKCGKAFRNINVVKRAVSHRLEPRKYRARLYDSTGKVVLWAFFDVE
ncbi:hypothetical protein ES703_24982 [subsurface metagenome]